MRTLEALGKMYSYSSPFQKMLMLLFNTYSKKKCWLYQGKISFLVTITVGQSLMQFFPSLLFKNDRILNNDGSFYSQKQF